MPPRPKLQCTFWKVSDLVHLLYKCTTESTFENEKKNCACKARPPPLAETFYLLKSQWSSAFTIQRHYREHFWESVPARRVLPLWKKPLPKSLGQHHLFCWKTYYWAAKKKEEKKKWGNNQLRLWQKPLPTSLGQHHLFCWEKKHVIERPKKRRRKKNEEKLLGTASPLLLRKSAN